MGWIGPAAGPALLAQEVWLMIVSLANWQCVRSQKSWAGPMGPMADRPPNLQPAAIFHFLTYWVKSVRQWRRLVHAGSGLVQMS